MDTCGNQVERILRELNLRNVADSRVGDDVHRGISGGEKRRLSVGVQLVTDPGCFVFFGCCRSFFMRLLEANEGVGLREQGCSLWMSLPRDWMPPWLTMS